MKLSDLYINNKLRQVIVANEDAKIIYLRPPRTASTSIFRDFLEKKIVGFVDFKTNPNGYIKWSESLTNESLKEYFIFTSVRNPYDRTISMLWNKKLPIKKLDFLLNNYDNIFLDNDRNRMHIEPFSVLNFFKSEKQFDFEIRFESLEDDFKELCKLIQIKKKPLRVNMASNGRKHYINYYDDKLIKIANKIYFNDFKFHNYKMVNSFCI